MHLPLAVSKGGVSKNKQLNRVRTVRLTPNVHMTGDCIPDTEEKAIGKQTEQAEEDQTFSRQVARALEFGTLHHCLVSHAVQAVVECISGTVFLVLYLKSG